MLEPVEIRMRRLRENKPARAHACVDDDAVHTIDETVPVGDVVELGNQELSVGPVAQRLHEPHEV